MKFYYVKLSVKEENAADREEATNEVSQPSDSERAASLRDRTKARQVENVISNFNDKNASERGFVAPITKNADAFVVAVKKLGADPVEFLSPVAEKLSGKIAETLVREIGSDELIEGLDNAEGFEFISNQARLLRVAGLSILGRNRYSDSFSDRIVEGEVQKETLFAAVEEMHLGAEYQSELTRIYGKGKISRFIGHPAHYIIAGKSHDYRKTVIRGLISALHEVGRLSSKRYTIFSIDEDPDYDVLERLYAINEGATVLIRAGNGIPFLRKGETAGESPIDDLFRIVRKHASETLTIFSFDALSETERNALRDGLGHLAMVSITPDLFTGESALRYVTKLAEKDGIEPDDELKKRLLRSKRGFLFEELDATYSEWKNQYLSTVLFPEYGTCYAYTPEVKKKKNALEELGELIGLERAKKTIKEALDYFKLRAEFARRNMDFRRPNMHMAFTGNPGTAKTTVARLVARIFKENGLLSVGELVEVGRNDLVAGYVGQTAPLVRSVFEKAKGSVLFIDEAYSLVDDRKGLYGDEAINTIVQLMENERDDLVVIFAGYTKEMQSFLDRNPGLRSRIAFQVPFDDYDEDALCRITELLAQKSGTKLASESLGALRSLYKDAMKKENFGNGRFARSLFEKAKIHLAARLSGRDLASVSDEELLTLHPEDFREASEGDVSDGIRIGFGA